MPEDESDERWTNDEPAPEGPAAAHDDIMKRLLDYQRSLREGASPEEAAEAIRGGVAERGERAETTTATEELVELEAPEHEPVTEPSSEPEVTVEVEPEPMEVESEPTTAAVPESELQARLSALEGKLDLIGSKIVEVRRSFQDLAIAADERLAALEDELERVRREHGGG